MSGIVTSRSASKELDTFSVYSPSAISLSGSKVQLLLLLTSAFPISVLSSRMDKVSPCSPVPTIVGRETLVMPSPSTPESDKTSREAFKLPSAFSIISSLALLVRVDSELALSFRSFISDSFDGISIDPITLLRVIVSLCTT